MYRTIKTLFVASLMVGLIYCLGAFVLADKNRTESPSMSSSESKQRRLWKAMAKLKCTLASDAKTNLTIKEAWFESVYEKYDLIPIRSKLIGVRLCIRFSAGVIRNGMWYCDYVGSGNIRGKQRVDSRGETVFVYEGDDFDAFSKTGDFLMFERIDKPAIATVSFEHDSRSPIRTKPTH